MLAKYFITILSLSAYLCGSQAVAEDQLFAFNQFPCLNEKCRAAYDPQNDPYAVYQVQETKVFRTNVTTDARLGKYGYDILSLPDRANKLRKIRVRGGLNRLSKDAHASVQFIMSW